MRERRLKEISRRDLLRLARTFGWTSTLLAATAMTGTITLPRLAAAVNSTHRKRFKKKARFNLKFAVALSKGYPCDADIFGFSQFVQDIEERTDGEIRIEIIQGFEICNQFDCPKRTKQGIIDLYAGSTQNAAKSASYFNVLDFAYLFPSRAAQYYFLYHPRSDKIFREPLTRHHGIRFLYTHCHLRGLIMGLKWNDKPDITSIDQLAGLNIRVTGTKLGKIALNLLKIRPVTVSWAETPDALKFGLVDGAETWIPAAASVIKYISQVVNLRLFSGNAHTAMNAKLFDKMPLDLQNAVMESSYHTQMFIQLAQEAALINTVGVSNPKKPDTILARNNVRFVDLPEEELKKAEYMCSPEFNPAPWEKWRERLNKMAGGIDIYQEIYKIAREIPGDTLVENVEQRRWWKEA